MNRIAPIAIAALLYCVNASPGAAQTPAAAKKDTTGKGIIRQAVIASPDGSYRMRIFARLAAQYQYTAPDSRTDIALNGATYSNKPITGATSLFRIRRARIGAEGNAFGTRLEYQLQLEMVGTTAAANQSTLKRYYINWHADGSDVEVMAGKFKVPYGRQQLTSGFSQAAVDHSQVSDEFAKGDDDGVMIWGMPHKGHFEYYAGVWNGEGNNRNLFQDTRNQYAGRLVWNPFGRYALNETTLGAPAKALSFGVAANLNGGWLFDVNGVSGIQAPTRSCTAGACTESQGDNARIINTNAEVAFRYGAITGQAEYFARTVNPDAPGLADLDANGWYGQAAAAVVPQKLDVGARYGSLDRDNSHADDTATELTFFAQRYIRGNDLKITTDYTLLSTPIPASAMTLHDSRVRVQLVVQL